MILIRCIFDQLNWKACNSACLFRLALIRVLHKSTVAFSIRQVSWFISWSCFSFLASFYGFCITAPAYLNATWVAVYPALLDLNDQVLFLMPEKAGFRYYQYCHYKELSQRDKKFGDIIGFK